MLEIVKKTSPNINRWLASVEKDTNVDPVLVSMLKGMEAKPELMKLLVIAKDMVAAKEPRLVGMAALLIGGFDHPRAHSFLELLLSNSDARLRMVALEAAQLGGSLWGLRKCINALGDREVAVRQRAQDLVAAWDQAQVRAMFEDLLAKGDTASLSDAADGLSRVAEMPLLDLVEKTFARIDLTLKRKLARGLVRIANDEVIKWVEEWQARLDDPDGYKVLDMAIVEMRRGPQPAAPGPVSATSITAQGAAASAGHAAPASHAAPSHTPPPPPPERKISLAGKLGQAGGGRGSVSPGNPATWGKMSPEQQAAMYSQQAAMTQPPLPAASSAPAEAEPTAETSSAVAGGQRATQRQIPALQVPGVSPEAPPKQAPPPATPAIATTPEDKERLFQILKELVTYGGSDIHVTAGRAPAIRQDGELITLEATPPSASELTRSIASVANPRQLERYMREGDLDMSIGVPGAGRFKVNFLKTRGAPGMVARLIPNEVPSLADLNLPPVLNQLATETKGILFVTGPTGSGKATTLATVVDLINSSRRGHIVTLDDPLEFIHRDRQCTITQREVGTDVRTFAEGIRFAQRMDADVILVGELTDPETIRAAFTAAGAGRLVLASSLTGSATKTVERLVGAFPTEEQAQVRINLATHLLAIVCQHLLHQAKGGRVPAHEVLLATPTIKKAIRENQPQAIYTQIEASASQGMVTMEQSLLRLLKAGQITREEAFSRAADPALLSQQL